MATELSCEDLDNLPPETDEEMYGSLVRGLSWQDGFGLYFVEGEEKKLADIANHLVEDLSDKQVQEISIEKDDESLYETVLEKWKKRAFDVLILRNLGIVLQEYERSQIQSGYTEEEVRSISWQEIPRILSHLNQQRERFRDTFPAAFVFLAPRFVIDYFSKRAPDFFEIKSGQVIRFPSNESYETAGQIIDGVSIEGDGNIVFNLDGEGNRIQVGRANSSVVHLVNNHDFEPETTYKIGKREPSLFQLPIDLSDFTGREKEIYSIGALLSQPGQFIKIFAFSGMGGVGKSALAIHVAHQLKSHYPDAQLWIDLRGQSEHPLTPEEALRKILVEGFDDEPQHLPLDLDGLQMRYRSHLAQRSSLIVLDNARDAAQVRPLLPGSANCVVFVTSRERLQLRETHHTISLDVLSEAEALELLGKLLGEAIVRDAQTKELAKLCGYLPLALQVAVALLRDTDTGLSLSGLVTELRDEYFRLQKLRVITPEGRILTDLDAEASLSLSYRRLTAKQQQVLAQVGMLRGRDFGAELAAIVGVMDAVEIITVLTQLCRFQLLKHENGRYSFHDLVRLFARGQLAEEAQRELALQALSWYDEQANRFDNYLEPTRRRLIAEGLVTEAEPIEIIEQALDQEALSWFAVEKENLVEAVAWAQEIGEHSLAVKLADNLTIFFKRRSHWGDWVITHKAALQSAYMIEDNQSIAKTMTSLGEVYQLQGKWQDAINCYEEALKSQNPSGDAQNIAKTFNNLGNVYRIQGKWQDAINWYEEALKSQSAIAYTQGIAQTLNNLGNVYQDQGRWQDAIDSYQQSLDTKRTIGDTQGIAQTLNNLGLVYQDQGKWQDAINCYEEALVIQRTIGDTHGIAQILNNLGLIYQYQGKWQDAINSYQQSLDTKWTIGDIHGIAQTLNNFGLVYQDQGRWQDAISYYEESLEIKRKIGDLLGEANTWFNLGNTQAKLHNTNARTSLQNAKALYLQLGFTSDVENCDRAIADIDQMARLGSSAVHQQPRPKQTGYEPALFDQLHLTKDEEFTLNGIRTSGSVYRSILRGRYRIEQELGKGSFGETYIAEDIDNPFNSRCVVKRLIPANTDPAFLSVARRLFNGEAEMLSKLGKQDRIPQLLAYFEEDQEFYLVQEFVAGLPLSVELPPGHRWQETKVVQLVLEVLETLKVVHGQGIIHGDIKPENLMRRQSDRKIVLIDFGVGKKIVTQAKAHQSPYRTIVTGTYGYIPTEQERGNPQFSSDLYALGMIAIQALTGVHPHDLKTDPKTGEFVWQNLATVAPQLATVLSKMVLYDYRQRYQTVAEILKAVDALQPKPLNWKLILSIGGIVVASLLLLGVLVQSITSQHDPQINLLQNPLPSQHDPQINPLQNPLPINPRSPVDVKKQALGKALSHNDLKTADQMTYELMLEMAGPKSKDKGKFDEEEWNQFSCDRVREIDQLWRSATKDTQGFRIQKEIFDRLGKNGDAFQRQVGWKNDSGEQLVKLAYIPTTKDLYYEVEPQFGSPPLGHLPAKLAWENGKDRRFTSIYACGL